MIIIITIIIIVVQLALFLLPVVIKTFNKMWNTVEK